MNNLLEYINEAIISEVYEVWDATYEEYDMLTVLYDANNDKWVFNIIIDDYEATYIIYTCDLQERASDPVALDKLINEIWYYNNQLMEGC